MTVVKLEHSNQAEHQAAIFKCLQKFRNEGQLCDVILKSRDGKEHQAHKAVLCAASEDLKNMLLGPFHEAEQVKEGQPVEMAASDTVVFALLEYIYGHQPQVELEDSLELLHLADAYNLSELAATIQAGLHASLESAPVTMALKVLRQSPDLHDLKVACEDKVAVNFEACIDVADFLELSPGQLSRILQRADMKVSSEEVVVQGLFNWFKKSKDGGALGALLQNIDFPSLSSHNLARLRHLSASMGPVGRDLHREVGNALQVHKKRSAERIQEAVCPKRRCLQQWSPDLGATSQAPRKVSQFAYSMCWHNGVIYGTTQDRRGSSIFRLKPGDTESQTVAGRGAAVNGVNDLGRSCRLSVSTEGIVFVADVRNDKLLSFRNGSGNVVVSDAGVLSISCSPNGDVFVLTQEGRVLNKLVGATLHPVISNKHLPAALQFEATNSFVTKDEVIYLSDVHNRRILRVNPGETEPVVVGEIPNKESSNLQGLFVTEEDKIYVADYGQRKVWAFHPGDATWTEVLTCPGDQKAMDVLVQGGSLYVSMGHGNQATEGVYEYFLPPELQLG